MSIFYLCCIIWKYNRIPARNSSKDLCYDFCPLLHDLHFVIQASNFFKTLYQTYIETYIWNTKAEFLAKTMQLKEKHLIQ